MISVKKVMLDCNFSAVFYRHGPKRTSVDVQNDLEPHAFVNICDAQIPTSENTEKNSNTVPACSKTFET